jgi:RNA polymerase sigma factor (sigma-70 family)
MSRPNAARPARKPMATPDAEGEAPLRTPAPADGSWRAHLVWLRTRLRDRFGPDLADDLAQETYLRIVGQRARASAESPRGFLLTVATNLARDAFRRDRVRADYAARALRASTAPGATGHTAEDDLQVRQAILSLPPKLREVLLLSKIGGLTNREIAQRYGLSVRAIDKRLQKAITLFVAQLRD